MRSVSRDISLSKNPHFMAEESYILHILHIRLSTVRNRIFAQEVSVRRVLLVGILILILAPAADAQGIKLGVGGFGGLNIPIAQDDQGNGSVFGVMARVSFMSLFVAEPNVTFGSWGEPDPVNGFDLGIDGSSINSYGVDVTIGGLPGVRGLKPYGFVGAAIYSIDNDDTGYDESKLGYSLGLGLNFGIIPTFDIDVRGRMVIAPQDDGSKKAVYVTGGLIYYFNIGQ